MGARVSATLTRPGFYPAGGGRIELGVHPCPALKPLELLVRGKPGEHQVRAMLSNLPAHIGEREVDVVRRKLQWSDNCCQVLEVDSNGPGNVVLVEVQFENVTEVFVAFGEKGRKAERVARDVGRQAASYLKSDVPVGEYLADQLMLPMAIGKAKGTGGGSYRTGPLSLHSTTHIDIIREFLDIEVSVTEQDDAFLVSID